MNQLLFYLLQVISASALLYGYYHFALRNKRFHRYNRFYLLMALIISITIPFLNIPVYFTSQETDSSVMLQTLQVITSGATEMDAVRITTETSPQFSLTELLYIFYAVAGAILFVRILFSFNKIRLLIKNHTIEPFDKIKFVNTDEPGTPFSFFKWLFWNRKIDMHTEKGEQIFRHELFHIQQKHSWDIVFIELAAVVFWINPFFHLIRKEIKAIHEFLADEFAIKENNNWQYAEILLMQVLNTNNQLVNPFFHNQIKRRIAMITSSTKPSYQYLRKIMVLPIAALVIFLFAFTYKNNDPIEIEKSINSITIVVDAGHGGTDKGALSKNGKQNEAELSLAIAKKIQLLAPYYNIRVVMTREDDNFPGGATNKNDGLRKRVEIANSIKLDAFISIHMNSSPSTVQTTRSGFDIYLSKKDNKVDLTLASAISGELRDVYTISDAIKYRQEQAIFVLDKSNSPSLLLECGYMNNPKDISFFSSDKNQEDVARAILEGVAKFSNNQIEKFDDSVHFSYDPYGKEISEQISDTIKPKKSEDLSKYLVVINGVVQEKRGLKSIDSTFFNNKQPIEARIYRDKSAIDKYGEQGNDGVIEIYTNRISGEKRATKLSRVSPDTVVWIKEIPIPTRKSPSAFEFKSWEDSKIYGVWINADRINNSDLKKYKPSDFGWYNVSKLAKNAVNYGKHVYQVSLYTQKYYDEKIAARNDKLAVIVKDNSDTVKVVKEEPLIVVDGKQVSVGLNHNLNEMVSPENIYSITVLKGRQATDKYGDKAKDRVIEITTKNNLEIKEVTLEPLNDNKVFEKVEVEASFPGGVTAWRKFITSNVNSTVPVDSGSREGTYTVILQFIVDKGGNVSNIKALTKHGFGMEQECIRVMKLSPKWNPALQNGIPVTAIRKQPFTFVIADNVEEPKEELKEVEVKGVQIPGKNTNNKATTNNGPVEEIVVTGYKINKAEVDKLSPIYPNPTSNSVTISYDSKQDFNGEIRVYDVMSSLKMISRVNFKKGKNNTVLNVASLASGTYIINVVDASGKALQSYKVIKQ